MKLGSRPQAPASGQFLDTFTNIASLGTARTIKEHLAVEDATSRRERLEDLRLPDDFKELLHERFQELAGGTVEHTAATSLLDKNIQIQYTVARVGDREWTFVDIPGEILSDGSRVRRLYELAFLLRGRTVRVFSRELPGPPASAFNGLKKLWESEEPSHRINIEFVPRAYVQELFEGKGDLENVLQLKLSGLPASPHAREGVPATHAGPAVPAAPRTLTLFLASSEELSEQRDDFTLHFLERNKFLERQGARLDIVRWESIHHAFSDAGTQAGYDQRVSECDILVCLFHSKAGAFTEEEFDAAHEQYTKTGKPTIFIFFDKRMFSPDISVEELQSLREFQQKLVKLGHYNTEYQGTDSLKLKFQGCLDEWLPKWIGETP
jgi:hypothetical protein